ncbi:ribonuclease P protein component [Marmoricola endophyticus]|uniref:Ribonuclease P protein component n=1 Tax=Marmoricola endophyticus TaxID=2040280 RepID=A0A917BKU8_9ACTN|nr:ribonuclease P protein component [Marmoricola endophyticus]GGF47294.1 ribonuclease P protein component [Marmoricola endophyticus]
MLPRSARLTRSADFGSTVREGERAGSRLLVVHLRPAARTDETPRAGFVVSRAVGGAVVRNRVERRLRHLVRDRLAALPAGSLLVVRALPAAAAATSEELGRSLDRGLERVAAAVAS